MTYSLLARDPDSGSFGLAVASRFFAVGAICPWSAGGIGALMTQALPNPEWGPRGLQLLTHGHNAADVCALLVAQDRGRDQRQLHLIDRHGNAAAHSGGACVDWFGHRNSENLSVAGNMLAGPEVVNATFERYASSDHLPMVDRLINAMRAGEQAGGDKRGRQSIALRIQGPQCYPRLDLRVDDHADPIAELERLYAVAQLHYIPFSSGMPGPGQPYGILDRRELERRISKNSGTLFALK